MGGAEGAYDRGRGLIEDWRFLVPKAGGYELMKIPLQSLAPVKGSGDFLSLSYPRREREELEGVAAG